MKVCKQCGKELPSTRWVYCSEECHHLFNSVQYKKLNPRYGRTSATTGAIAELRVSIDLLQKGYDVFRALSPSCSCDLAILKDAKILRIEVRTCFIGVTGKIYKVKSQRDSPEKADVYAWVLPDKIIYEPELL